jgi:hypothetical protein
MLSTFTHDDVIAIDWEMAVALLMDGIDTVV